MSTSILCLMGPTAAGKTALAFELAKQFPIDIISVDSALIYRDMNIGTAKPTAEELAHVPHRLINILDPSERYSAAEFCQTATQEIANSLQRGRMPVLVGGTMLYFKALQHGLASLPSADPQLRQQLTEEVIAHGNQYLHQRLHTADPISAAKIHPNDPQRTQRALEVYLTTGIPLSELIKSQAELLPYDWINIIVAPSSRELLHQRIEQRLDRMLELGFIDEVRALYARGDLHADLPAIRSVGYRQIWQYLSAPDNNLAALKQRILFATRQFAKRQLTWCRQWKEAEWLDGDDVEALDIIKQKVYAKRDLSEPSS